MYLTATPALLVRSLEPALWSAVRLGIYQPLWLSSIVQRLGLGTATEACPRVSRSFDGPLPVSVLVVLRVPVPRSHVATRFLLFETRLLSGSRTVVATNFTVRAHVGVHAARDESAATPIFASVRAVSRISAEVRHIPRTLIRRWVSNVGFERCKLFGTHEAAQCCVRPRIAAHKRLAFFGGLPLRPPLTPASVALRAWDRDGWTVLLFLLLFLLLLIVILFLIILSVVLPVIVRHVDVVGTRRRSSCRSSCRCSRLRLRRSWCNCSGCMGWSCAASGRWKGTNSSVGDVASMRTTFAPRTFRGPLGRCLRLHSPRATAQSNGRSQTAHGLRLRSLLGTLQARCAWQPRRPCVHPLHV